MPVAGSATWHAIARLAGPVCGGLAGWASVSGLFVWDKAWNRSGSADGCGETTKRREPKRGIGDVNSLPNGINTTPEKSSKASHQ